MQFLKRGYVLCNGIRIKDIIKSCSNYQIYSGSGNSIVMVATACLYTFWISESYALPDLFIKEGDYYCLISDNESYFDSISLGPSIVSPETLGVFMVSYIRALNINDAFHLNEAIFDEKHFILLPMMEIDSISNEIALGKFLTGGVCCSYKDRDVLSKFGVAPIEVLDKTVEILESKDLKVLLNATEEENVLSNCQEKAFILPGRPILEKFFNEHIIDVIKNLDKYQKMGVDFPGATVLYGPPGTGKTYAVEQLASFLGWRRYDINSSSIGSPYIHETSKKINEVFASAIENAPSVLIIDEMDAFLSERSGVNNLHHAEEMAEFLKNIPKAIEKHVLIFAMTNRIDQIDKAILRRGRFDNLIEVNVASSDDIVEMLKARCRNLPLGGDVKLVTIAEKLEGRPLSDVEFVVKEAGRLAAQHNLEAIGFSCFETALALLPNEEKRTIGFN